MIDILLILIKLQLRNISVLYYSRRSTVIGNVDDQEIKETQKPKHDRNIKMIKIVLICREVTAFHIVQLNKEDVIYFHGKTLPEEVILCSEFVLKFMVIQ